MAPEVFFFNLNNKWKYREVLRGKSSDMNFTMQKDMG